ncbi:MAG: hypothetical protein SCH71_15605 [Desulfobulbaceae bacterium]|nr:hypothetical protein [Desulfobulbaceae bacterium]
MKRHFATSLVFILALIIANSGFVRAEFQLCRTKCEYSAALSNAGPPPCCKSGKAEVHETAMADHDDAMPADCPHLNSNLEPSDTLTFLAVANPIPAPPQAAAFSEILSAIKIPDTRFAGYSTRTGRSHPERKSPPVYHLNCSLLI